MHSFVLEVISTDIHHARPHHDSKNVIPKVNKLMTLFPLMGFLNVVGSLWWVTMGNVLL